MVEITILRTSDGTKHQVDIGLHEKLDALKDKISKCPSLTSSPGGYSIRPSHQRVFHLGRELKTRNRSLSTLGIGKHNVFLVHLFSSQPATLELSSDEDDDVVVVTSIHDQTRRGKKRSITAGIDNGIPIEEAGGNNNDSGRCNEGGEIVEVNTLGETRIKPRQDGRTSTVVQTIDLLESDDDDVIEVEPPDKDIRSKRSRAI